MIERRPILDAIGHLVLILGVLAVVFPLYVAFVASTQTAEQSAMSPLSLVPGGELFNNYSTVLFKGASGQVVAPPVINMLWVSLVTALVIAVGKIAISMLSAFALVYFRFPGRNLFFWMIFVTLMLPVEVRITPTYQVVSNFGMLNSYAGLTIPLIASATATFLFRQFFLTVPDELAEAARIDGAGPLRFLKDVLWPLSRTNVIALFVIMFIYGWNQYLWPLMIATQQDMYPIGIGIKTLISGGDSAVEWNMVMATMMLAMLPPGLIVVVMQKWFVKGLVDSEK
ncbi:sn-glycerol-3-phosphate ABC transporter permease UgpE [Herbaspirillum sp.]|uniref:sn-glycerol-3-phosphate ABC transporter permease UgpE n=1 Tax=Herbaspirillum sp. TaxID=1890675 RepID=UPI001B0C3DAB|nr:sn-glycerol-3-phosphate ABC transporter permease UgpE [Herbaspirillum sp.]MBO9538943.1 sn-glycerol-3-phosphate ABC transporter permease UgpE [Herbaspirillum sp.]